MTLVLEPSAPGGLGYGDLAGAVWIGDGDFEGVADRLDRIHVDAGRGR